MNVKAQLLELAEPSYQRFSSRLLPGTPDILGVRYQSYVKSQSKSQKKIGVNF